MHVKKGGESQNSSASNDIVFVDARTLSKHAVIDRVDVWLLADAGPVSVQQKVGGSKFQGLVRIDERLQDKCVLHQTAYLEGY